VREPDEERAFLRTPRSNSGSRREFDEFPEANRAFACVAREFRRKAKRLGVLGRRAGSMSVRGAFPLMTRAANGLV